ncbi:methyl-accepting chemotaxis protein [Spirochaetia bacterium]|nr:methyl-accepting chemotaxis protein [Spirochaetia bacterium]
MTISYKINLFIITFIVVLSLASFIGFGVFMYNSSLMQSITRDLTKKYNDTLAQESFEEFNAFLKAIQASSGIAQDLGELFYALKDTLTRKELEDLMNVEYHKAFARETSLLGGGAFYEPNVFYPEDYDFHHFVSKILTAQGIPDEKSVQWLGDEWAWDVDTYEEGWYQIVLPKGWSRSSPRDKRHYWSELYIDTSVNALMVTVSLPMYSDDQRIVGVATVDVSLATLQQVVTSVSLPTPSTIMAGFSTINNATFAMSKSTDYQIVPYPTGSWLSQLEQLKPGQTFINEDFSFQGVSYSLYASVHESGIGVAMLVPNAEKYQAVDALQKAERMVVIIIVFTMLIIILGIIYTLKKWVVTPIKEGFGFLENVAKGDLSQPIEANSKKGLDEMQGALITIQGNLKKGMDELNDQILKMTKLDKQLNTVIAESSDDLEVITDNMDFMEAKVNTQMESVLTASDSAVEILDHAGSFEITVHTQVEYITKSSAAIKQMVTNITAVRSIVANTSRTTDTLSKSSESGHRMLLKLAEELKEIEEQSATLQTANKTISDIAGQTNILAMNAAIEAAHAGEAGRGFAVVAGEVRKLAELAGKESESISTEIKKMERAIEQISQVSNETVGAMDTIFREIKVMDTSFDTVNKAIAEQAAGGNQILTALKDIQDMTGQVREGAGVIHQRSGSIHEEMEKLQKISREVTEITHKVRLAGKSIASFLENAKKLA